MITLSLLDKLALQEALLACRSMGDEDTRDSIVAGLPREVRNTIKRNAAPATDVDEILSACLYYDAMNELFMYVGYYEGPSAAMRDVQTLWERLSWEGVVGLDGVRQLAQIVEQRRPDLEKLRSAYQRALYAHGAAMIDEPPEDVEAMVKHVAGFSTQLPGKHHALLVFVESYAELVDDETLQERLRSWVDEHLSAFGVDSGGIVQLRDAIVSQLGAEGRLQPYLLVVIEPDPASRNRDRGRYSYDIYSWLNKRKKRKLAQSTGTASLQELLAQLEADLNRLLGPIAALFKLSPIVEFFVPYELLSWNVASALKRRLFDGRVLNLPSSEAELGKVHPLVMRSRDRIVALRDEPDSQEMRREWERRWQTFESQGGQACCDGVYWLKSQDLERPDLANWFRFEMQEPFVSLALNVRRQQAVYTSLLQLIINGLPVGLWPSAEVFMDQPLDPDTFRLQVEAALATRPLAELRELVQESRRQSGSDLGRYLTLFWDDPDRIPPGYEPPKAQDMFSIGDLF